MQWMMVCTQVDGSVWATLLALIWLYGCKIEQQVEWQFVAMKAASWIGSQKGEISIPDHIDSVSVHQETFELISSVLWHTHWFECVCVCFSGRSVSVCVFGECPARMSGDQRDSGNLKTSVFLHPDLWEDQRTETNKFTVILLLV